jgi:hypothetical protein
MHTLRSRNALPFVLSFFLLSGGLVAGCGGGDDNPITLFTLPMRGAHEIPAVTSTGGGTANVQVFGDSALNTDQINVVFTPTGLTNANVTRSHIHVNNGLEPNGPVILTLYESTTDGAFTGTISKSFPSNTAAFTPNPGAGINNFGDLVTAIMEGRAYVNLHTTQNPGGELRAPLGSEFFQVVLNGANERPNPVTTAATGTASVSFNSARDRVNVGVGVTNITAANISMAHIHAGGPNDVGPPIFTIYNRATDGALANPRMFRSLTAANFTAGGGIDTFAEALSAIRGGLTYINVHTDAFPDGEIRGQITTLP